MGKFKQDSNCYWQGHGVFRVIGRENSSQVILVPVAEKFNMGHVVSEQFLEPVASEVFAIGDPVRSAHVFKGVVTAFEPETNRVICVKAGVSATCTRTDRWAYKPSELMKIEGWVPAINQTYTVRMYDGSCFMVRALPHISDESQVVLYRVDNGGIFKYVSLVNRNVPNIEQDGWEVL